MKFRWDKKYLYWGLTAICVFLFCIAVVYVLFNGSSVRTHLDKLISICMPIIDGLVIAYLLSPVVNTLENKVLYPMYKKRNMDIDNKLTKRTRIYSISLTVLFALGLVYGFIMIVIPRVYDSILSIIGQMPAYYNNVMNWLDKLFDYSPQLEEYVTDYVTDIFNKFSNLDKDFLSKINDIVRTLSLSIISVLKETFNLVIGFIISIYLLYNKERFLAQAKKAIYAIWDRENANGLIRDLRLVNKTFGGFISGKLLDSLIIGILCFICLSFIGTPYPLLISVIVGITNVIPFFGPYLGAIPSALLILLVEPVQCVYFIIFILILQQFDGNILGPKILGNSIGLSSGFWIIFSITIFGGLFGIVGMVIGVPLFAVFYTFASRRVRRMLRKRGYPEDTDAYTDLERIDESNHIIPKNK